MPFLSWGLRRAKGTHMLDGVKDQRTLKCHLGQEASGGQVLQSPDTWRRRGRGVRLQVVTSFLAEFFRLLGIEMTARYCGLGAAGGYPPRTGDLFEE